MAHEITETDNVVLNQTPAWHGLGVVVEQAPTPTEALKLAGLDWEVEQWPLYATNGEGDRVALDWVSNVRLDTKQSLGVVSPGWTPFQNREVADFCEALAEQGDTVRIESAGSIRGGAKIWFLLRSESFAASHDDDIITPYICVSNGFDGGTGFRATPTTVRVVCSNTLHMVIPQVEGRGRMEPAGFMCQHSSNLKQRVEQAKAALKLYGRAVEDQRKLIDGLAAKDVNSDMVKRFFLECYTRDFKAIPDQPGKLRDKALDAVASMSDRFERESDQFGANAWVMMNAYTGWLQNDRPSRVKDPQLAREQRAHSKLFATDSKRTLQSLSLALSS